MAFLAGIIMNLCAIFVENGLLPAAVVETMQYDLHTCRMQSLNGAEYIDDPAVVHGVGYIVTHDMNCFIVQLAFEKSRDKIE
jgi:hypothetical protein